MEGGMEIPSGVKEAEIDAGGRRVRLTNLDKPFWPELNILKRDLLGYYAQISKFLLPHLEGRAMVMKRYPHGAHGEFFFMKRTPNPHPEWLETCSIEHASKSIIAFPVVNDLASLLWIVNLGCIDLNQWYAKCDDVNRPDYLHFDLDPVMSGEGKPTRWKLVLEAACAVREALDSLNIPSYPKTTGSRGLHIYVPIARGPLQKQVWTFAKEFARTMEAKHPSLITAEYRIAKRPAGRVLVDYNQNAWGRTLASVYSVRPRPGATVSTPVTWDEVVAGFRMSDFHLRNVPDRVQEKGDLFRPLLQAKGRVRLEKFLK
jgi:bifunctional non-homologous end joining protein LigD